MDSRFEPGMSAHYDGSQRAHHGLAEVVAHEDGRYIIRAATGVYFANVRPLSLLTCDGKDTCRRCAIEAASKTMRLPLVR